MTVGELRETIKGLPDDTEVQINSIWDDDAQELAPSACSGFYHEQRQKVFLTPDRISIQGEMDMDTIYLDDITGTIGVWLDMEFDNEVPYEVVELLEKAYNIASKEFEK